MQIEVNNLVKKFGDFVAVDDVSLDIQEGQIFGLLGVNGAGKTTLIKMLACLLSPTSGDAKVGGFSVISQESDVKNIINISPQETSVAGNLTVFENLEFIAGIYGNKDAKQSVEQIIKDFALEDVKNKLASKLSGGMQRRLSIASALITNPKILFLDEPTLALDVLAKRELWEIIKSLKGKMTIILTTHNMEEAEFLCDNIAIMNKGKICIVGTSQELKQKSNASNFEDAFVYFAGGVK